MSDTILDIRKDTEALKQLADLEELVSVPTQRGGVYFSDWEKKFIQDIREQHNRTLDFTEKQRDKIKSIWQAVDLRNRTRPDEKVENLFSKLSPARQAEQRERANRVRLPWGKMKAVDAWLAGRPPTVRFIIAELEVGGVVHMRASSDEVGDDGPIGIGKTHEEALAELEKLLAKELFS